MANATISWTTPGNGISGVAVNANITIQFTSQVRSGRGVIELRDLDTKAVVETFDVQGSNRLTLSTAPQPGVSTLTIDPTSTLRVGGRYALSIPGGTYVDLGMGGWPYGKLTTPTVINFTASATDAVSPVVLPLPSQKISTDANFSVRFDEPIALGNGTITLYEGSPSSGKIIETFAANSPRVTVSGSTITVDPAASLGKYKTYSLAFASGAVKDLAGNAYSGTVTFTSAGNSSPFLDYLKSPRLQSVNEDASAPTPNSTEGATRVSSLLGNSQTALANYFDADGDPGGLAVIDVGWNVKLFYSTNNGATWQQASNLTARSALTLTLDPSNWIYVVANPNFYGEIYTALTIRAWDGTGGYGTRTGVDTTTYSSIHWANFELDGVHSLARQTYTNGTSPGPNAYGVAVSGNRAYLAMGDDGVSIIDVTDNRNPSFVANISPRTETTLGYAEAVAVSGNYAYVADRFFGLVVLDVSAPASPLVLSRSSLTTVAWSNAVALSGNLALLSSSNSTNGLRIFDVSSPLSPLLKSTLSLPVSAYDVAVKGNMAYVAAGQAGVYVVDFTDPTRPTLMNIGVANVLDTPGFANSVAVSGDVLYVADGIMGGLRAYSLSATGVPQATPLWVNSSLSNTFKVAASGSSVFSSDINRQEISLLDVSQAGAPPVLIKKLTGVTAWDLSFAGRQLYVASTQADKSLSIYSDGNASPFSTNLDDVSVTINPVNDPPSLAKLPVGIQSVQVGQPVSLAGIAVADPDGSNESLTLTLTTVNGNISALSDADLLTPGIQVLGTVSAINTALAGATFAASSAGMAKLSLSLSDRIAPVVTGVIDYSVDPTPQPSVTITSNLSPRLAASGDVIYSVNFSASSISDLTASDFLVTNGKVKSLSGSAGSYTLTVTPDANRYGNLLVELPANSANQFGIGNLYAKANLQPYITLAQGAPPFDISLPYGALVSGQNFSLQNKVEFNGRYYYAAYNDKGNSLVSAWAAPTSAQIGGYQLTMPTQTELNNVLYARMPVGSTSNWQNGSMWAAGTYYWSSAYGYANFLSSTQWNPNYVFGSGYTVQGRDRVDAMLIYQVSGGTTVAAFVDKDIINEQTDRSVEFTFVRSGNINASLSVGLTIGGVSITGGRYRLSGGDVTLSGTKPIVTFAAGSSVAKVVLTAIDNQQQDAPFANISVSLDRGTYTSANSTPIALTLMESGPVGAVNMSGLFVEGNTLTASSSLTDLDGIVSPIAYRWLLDGNPISGANQPTLVLTRDMAGHTVSVQAYYTDGAGKAEQLTSNSALIQYAFKPPSGGIEILGVLAQGHTLYASTASLSDPNGFGVMNYQWLVDGVPVTGASGPSFFLSQSVVGRTISVEVTYADGVGFIKRVNSPVTGAIENVNDAPTGSITITNDNPAHGTAAPLQGDVLRASNNLSDADGIPASGDGAILYHWLADGVAISGANADALTLGQELVGKAISVRASYTDHWGSAESVVSALTGMVLPPPDVPPQAPSINALGGTDLMVSTMVGDAWVSGTAEPNVGITLQYGSTVLNQTPIMTDGDGKWSFSLTANHLMIIGQGTGKTLMATATNASGLTSQAVTSPEFSVDTILPVAISFSPADNALAVAVSRNIVMTFNEAVLKGSGNILISSGADTRTIAVSDPQVTVLGNTVTINPLADLMPNHNYWVQMAAGVFTDVAGNSYAGISNTTDFNFATVDGLAPTLVGTSPSSRAKGVPVGNDIVFTFSESVRKGSGTIVISNGVETRLIAVGDSQVRVSGNTVTINPTVDLQPNSVYSVYMASGVITDLTGNAFAGNTTSRLTFTTGLKPGTNGNDNIVGTSGDDTIYGLDGNDSLSGSIGNDLLFGGEGADTMMGGRGNDTIHLSEVRSMSDAVVFSGGSGAGFAARVASLGFDTINGINLGSSTSFVDKLLFSAADFGIPAGSVVRGTSAAIMGGPAANTDGNLYIVAAGPTRTSVDLNGTQSANGAALVCVGSPTGTDGVTIWYTPTEGAFNINTAIRVASLSGVNTSNLNANDFGFVA